jgi:hypothetical protein
VSDPRHVHSDATILDALRGGESPRAVHRRLGCTWQRVKTLAIAHGLYPAPRTRRTYVTSGRRYIGQIRVPDDWIVVEVAHDGSKITMMRGTE